jgi:FixJ family two-component response regulator
MLELVNWLEDAFMAVRMPVRRDPKPTPRTEIVTPTALVVIRDEPGASSLPSMLHDAGWRLMVEHSTASALARQRECPAPVVLYDRAMPDADWRKAARSFSQTATHPCLVLLSERTDANLWEELVRCGGFDMLRTPVERESLIRTVSAAWLIWRVRQ